MPAIYHVNPRKALEVILWLTERQNPIDFYHVLKVIYFADKHHLNTYGRPILGDTYDALSHGPVARTVYNLLKNDGLEFQALDESSRGGNDPAAFEVTGRYWVHGRRAWNRSLLSESDVAALSFAFDRYGAKSFRELERLAHDELGWQNAMSNGGVIRYEDLIEDDSRREEIIENIGEFSQRVVF